MQKLNTWYKIFKEKIWPDPVWSKVISGVILAIGTGLYLLIKSLVSEISFGQAFIQFWSFLKNTTSVNNWLLILLSVTTVYSFFIYIKRIIARSTKPEANPISEKEKLLALPPIGFNSDVFFDQRLAAAFPGERGLVWYNDPKTAVDRLMIMLQQSLEFKAVTEEASSTPIWWYRDTSSMYVAKCSRLSRTKVLMDIYELEIKRIAVYKDRLYWKNFVYVETNAERQIGLNNFTPDDIKKSVDYFGYCSEEYAILNNTPIKRAEYDDGAAIINDKVVEAFGAELRIRYISDYNFIFAPHNSPYNSHTFMQATKTFFDAILKNAMFPDKLFEFLLKLPRYASYKR